MNSNQMQDHLKLEPLRPDDEVSLIDLVAVLIKHRKFVVTLTCICCIVALLFTAVSLVLPPRIGFLPNKYTAKATMLINDQSGSGLSSMLASSGLSSMAGLAGISAGGKSNGQLAVFLTKQNGFLDEIADKYGLAERYKVKKNVRTGTRKATLKHMKAAFDEKTGTFTLSFEDVDPEFAKNVVNYGVGLLDARFATIGGNRNLTRKEQLEAKLADVKAEIARLEDEIQRFQQRYGVISADTLATEQITTIAKVRSELIMKDMDLKTYSQLSRVQDPVYKRLQTERDNLAKLLDQLESGQNANSDLLPSQRELPKIALEFSHLKRDLLVQEQIYQLLTSQYEATKLALAGEEPVFQVLELAEAPDQKSGPSRAMIVIIATLAGLFVGILMAFVLDAINNVRNDPEAMAKLRGRRA